MDRRSRYGCVSPTEARENVNADTVSEQRCTQTHVAVGLSTLVIDVTVSEHESRYL